jgi:hypothetical protein
LNPWHEQLKGSAQIEHCHSGPSALALGQVNAQLLELAIKVRAL